jgi:hypothetical protein
MSVDNIFLYKWPKTIATMIVAMIVKMMVMMLKWKAITNTTRIHAMQVGMKTVIKMRMSKILMMNSMRKMKAQRKINLKKGMLSSMRMNRLNMMSQINKKSHHLT